MAIPENKPRLVKVTVTPRKFMTYNLRRGACEIERRVCRTWDANTAMCSRLDCVYNSKGQPA